MFKTAFISLCLSNFPFSVVLRSTTLQYYCCTRFNLSTVFIFTLLKTVLRLFDLSRSSPLSYLLDYEFKSIQNSLSSDFVPCFHNMRTVWIVEVLFLWHRWLTELPSWFRSYLVKVYAIVFVCHTFSNHRLRVVRGGLIWFCLFHVYMFSFSRWVTKRLELTISSYRLVFVWPSFISSGRTFYSLLISVLSRKTYY